MTLAIAKNIGIEEKMANRHGLIAGATGTGKTITLKVMTEQFSKAGIPVFLQDGDADTCNGHGDGPAPAVPSDGSE